MKLQENHPLIDGRTANSGLIRAYRGERPDVTPVWFMRQAGRSLPEYRELRVGTAMLDACLNPELSSEITLQPVRRHGVSVPRCPGLYLANSTIESGAGPVDINAHAGLLAAQAMLAEP